MALQLPGWSGEIERSFKEILFRFLEEVHCTKAALYLLSPDGEYLLATQYGFGRKDLLTAQYPPSTELPLRASKLGNRPEAINHPEEAPEIYEILQGAGSHKMLLVPLSSGVRLLGFVDARDKGRKMPFDSADEKAAVRIASEILQLIQITGLVDFGSVVETPSREESRPTRHRSTSPSSKPASPIFSGEGLLDPIGLWELTRSLEMEMSSNEELGSATLSIVEGRSVSSKAFVIEGASPDGLNPVFQHQFELLQSAGIDCQPTAEWKISQEAVTTSSPHRPLILGSRILVEEKGWTLLVSLVGSAESGALPRCMDRLENLVQEASSASWCRYSRFLHTKKILESSEDEFQPLVRHSMAVSELSWSLAHEMGLGYPIAEQAAIAGLLHDVGMLNLEDRELYRDPNPGESGKQSFKKHSEWGEKTAIRHGFGDVARIIRSHHERWDGEGYPDRLRAEDIPILSRIVHVAEVFDTLTSSTSYLSPIAPAVALAKMEEGAGAQFDPLVIGCLREVL